MRIILAKLRFLTLFLRFFAKKHSFAGVKGVVVSGFAVLVAGLLAAQPALALTSAQLKQFSQNNILFYDPSGNNCTSAATTIGNSDGSDVYLIGDSISVQSQSAIRDKLESITIDALSGTYFSHDSDFGPGGTERISNMGDQDILVFAMGTNGGINSMYSDDTSKLMSALSGKNAKVILMTIYYNGFSTDQMNSSNEVVRSLASANANISYFDWYDAVKDNPSKYISSDGVHPTADGNEKFAELIKTAVNKVTSMAGSSAPAASGSGYDALKNATRTYGDFAMQMQIEFGTPWEVVMAQMQIESGTGTCTNCVASAVAANGYYNWLGITGSGDAGSWVSSGGRSWAQFSSVEKSIEAWAGTYVLRNGYYNDAFPYLDPGNWDLEAFLVKMISHYAPNSDGNNEAGYVQKIIYLLNGPIKEVREEKGWPSSEEFAKQNNIPVGGKHPIDSQIDPSSISANSSYSSSYCTNTNSTNSGGVTLATYEGQTIAFPIAGATKETVRNYVSTLPCEGATYGCHYGRDNPSGLAAAAWDLCFNGNSSVPCDNATVVSITDGEIVGVSYERTHNGETVPCNHVRIRNAIDNTVIAYMHLAYEPDVVAGTQVKAGDVIGHVSPGVSACNDHSVPHVHIDKASDPSLTGGPYADQRDPEIVAMVNAGYYALPENEAELARDKAASVSGDGAKPISPVYEDSDTVACDSHTTEVRVDTEAYHNGQRMTVRLCSVPNITHSGSETGHAIVNSRVSGAFYALAERYKEQTGNTAAVSEDFRTMAQQEYYYGCYVNKNCNGGNLAARPGYSNHQAGLAVDFVLTDSLKKFLNDNMADFGLQDGRNFSQPEYWHVYPIGG